MAKICTICGNKLSFFESLSNSLCNSCRTQIRTQEESVKLEIINRIEEPKQEFKPILDKNPTTFGECIQDVPMDKKRTFEQEFRVILDKNPVSFDKCIVLFISTYKDSYPKYLDEFKRFLRSSYYKDMDYIDKKIKLHEAHYKSMEEKRTLEQEFKVILDKNPASFDEYIELFISTYKDSYPEYLNQFQRLLYLSYEKTPSEVKNSCNKLIEEKKRLEEEFKSILDKNPATFDECIELFFLTYHNFYPNYLHEFKRLLYLSYERTLNEISKATKFYEDRYILEEEKRRLEEKFKPILDKNPVTLAEYTYSFLSYYKNEYPKHIEAFKRLLYLSNRKESYEIETVIKSYFNDVITYSIEEFESSYHSKPIYDLELILQFTKIYKDHYDKSDIEKLNKLLIQHEIKFHSVELLVFIVDLALEMQKFEDFKNKMLVVEPLNENELIKRYVRVYSDYIETNMMFFYKLLLQLQMTNLPFQEFTDYMSIKIFEMKLTSNDITSTIDYTATLNGFEFESFIGSLYEKMGYSVEQTPKSGDQGADLIVTKFGERTAVQTKNYTGNVGNKAVQEIVTAKGIYKCTSCSVVITSYFTKSAVEAADAHGVKLIDRDKLKDLINKYM